MNLLLRVVDPLEGPLRRGRRCRDRCGGRYDGWRRVVWQTQLRHHPRDPQPRAHKLVRDALAPRAQASLFYSVIFYVAPALREHEDYAQDAPNLKGWTMVVDQSHYHDLRSRAEPVSCRESEESETSHFARPVASFRNIYITSADQDCVRLASVRH